MLLLDTHAFIWLASDLSQLPDTAITAIRDTAECLYFASISALEIGLLDKRGRIILPLEPNQFIRRALDQHGLHLVSLDWETALTSATLPDIHNDPFDRILIATCLTKGMCLLSKDTIIPTYPDIRVIWE